MYTVKTWKLEQYMNDCLNTWTQRHRSIYNICTLVRHAHMHDYFNNWIFPATKDRPLADWRIFSVISECGIKRLADRLWLPFGIYRSFSASPSPTPPNNSWNYAGALTDAPNKDAVCVSVSVRCRNSGRKDVAGRCMVWWKLSTRRYTR